MKKVIRYLILPLADIIVLALGWGLSILLFNANLLEILKNAWMYLAGGALLGILVSLYFRSYSTIFKYLNLKDIAVILLSVLMQTVFFVVISLAVSPRPFGVSVTIVAMLITTVLLIASRVVIKFYHSLVIHISRDKELADADVKNTILIGAGSAGALLTNEVDNTDKIKMNIVCILDDDVGKHGLVLNGVRVEGAIEEVEYIAEKYQAEEIIIAMPSVSKKRISEIIKLCQKTKCEIKIIPGVYQFVTGQVSVSNIRKVNIQDLLGREQVKVNLDEIMGYIENKTILVTGGGGSIGSELCRQIATHNPKQLIIFDIYENNAYAIEQELMRNLPDLNLLTLIGSVRDKNKVENLFKTYRPDVVFHAAAHKHVPLMETSPNEAVKNNVGGTYNVADTAGKYGVKRFILISSDKAVNPTNIMGATKRICEMIIQTLNKKYSTEYVAVRFGNVLGSNGSVIPLFREQIKNGGPVTVTHKDIVRYFMTIPEAVSLVLQAGCYARGGEIFVLDMGEQVRIYDLAVNMIKLSGLTPNKDIEIKITGLRPGEKLYEERLMAEEGLQRTANEMISIGKPIEIDEEKLFITLDSLLVEAYAETEKMKELVHELVTTYTIDKAGDKARKSAKKPTAKATAKKPTVKKPTAKKPTANKPTSKSNGVYH